MKREFQIPVLEGGDVLVRSQKAVESVGSAEGPLVVQYVFIFAQFKKNVAGKNRQLGRRGFAAPAYVENPLRKMQGELYFGVLAAEKAYVFFFSPGFYLQGVIIHARIVAQNPVIGNSILYSAAPFAPIVLKEESMVNKRLGCLAALLLLMAIPASASMVSLLVVETGLNEEISGEPYGSLWEGGLMAAFFDAGYVVTNSPISRMEKRPANDLTGIARTDFDEAVTGGADFFVLGFLEYTVRGKEAIPVRIALKIFNAASGKMIHEQSFPAGVGKDLDEEYQNAQGIGQLIISRIKDR